MSICRVEKNENYTTISNFIMKDTRLSYKAKGIWLYAMSKPDHWEFNITDLANQSSDGKDSVRSGIKELMEFGYLRRENIKKSDGTWDGWLYVFYEHPDQKKAENPTTESLMTENPTLISTDILVNTEREKNVADDFFDKPYACRSIPLSLDASRLSSLLFSKIQENDPKFRTAPSHLENWSKEIDKISRIDKRTWQEIEDVILFATSNEFWKTNILSGGKLRKQFTTLLLQMKKDKPKKAQDIEKEKLFKNHQQWADSYTGIAEMHGTKLFVGKSSIKIKVNEEWIELQYGSSGFIEQLQNALRKTGVPL